jgi:hypothetical protein
MQTWVKRACNSTAKREHRNDPASIEVVGEEEEAPRNNKKALVVLVLLLFVALLFVAANQ